MEARLGKSSNMRSLSRSLHPQTPLDAGAPSTLISLPHEPYTRASPAPHPPHTPHASPSNRQRHRRSTSAFGADKKHTGETRSENQRALKGELCESPKCNLTEVCVCSASHPLWCHTSNSRLPRRHSSTHLIHRCEHDNCTVRL